MNKRGPTELRWQALPPVRWRQPDKVIATNALGQATVTVPAAVLEQKWQRLGTHETMWRPVETITGEVPVDTPSAGGDPDGHPAGDDNTDANRAGTQSGPQEDELARLRLVIDAIRPHAAAWISLLTAYTHGLIAVPGTDHMYASHELAAMKVHLGALLKQ